MSQSLCTTLQDKERLFNWLDEFGRNNGVREQPHIQLLERDLTESDTITDLRETPADLVTMRSTVVLRNLKTGKPVTCTLVYPNESNPQAFQISVLAPLGRAMLGHRVGDTLQVNLPVGPTNYLIESITYQPEAAGDFDR